MTLVGGPMVNWASRNESTKETNFRLKKVPGNCFEENTMLLVRKCNLVAN